MAALIFDIAKKTGIKFMVCLKFSYGFMLS